MKCLFISRFNVINLRACVIETFQRSNRANVNTLPLEEFWIAQYQEKILSKCYPYHRGLLIWHGRLHLTDFKVPSLKHVGNRTKRLKKTHLGASVITPDLKPSSSSLQYHCWIKHKTWQQRHLKKFLIVRQTLLVSTIGNVQGTVKKIRNLMLGN